LEAKHFKLKDYFPKVSTEKGPNAPFLSGKIQLGTYDFVLIAIDWGLFVALGLPPQMIIQLV
jgi:flavoprotein